MANIIMATATQMQNNFGKYLSMVQGGSEVIVTRNGKEIGRFIPKEKSVSYLTDSLAGILKQDIDPDMAKMDRLKDKYEITD
ncbi:MAG: type II toxin-antitoxin system prevent-host-death family antitoxin [Clostridiales bacterium]|nr:type II toxin-antitoxin system prevent-host-death family antitoxin [Clostridiales bacterium]